MGRIMKNTLCLLFRSCGLVVEVARSLNFNELSSFEQRQSQ